VHVLTRWRRSAAALAAAAAIIPLTAATADAAPGRTATTTDYTNATYLQHALGLPAAETNPAIESVTYDHFQWLLQQPGNSAFLIGDPVLDPTFAARAREVEAAADAAGVKNVYWFDPNLSGSAEVGGITEPALDIRNPTAITQLNANSQTTYGAAWLNLVGQYLGNGVTTTLVSGDVGDEDPKITAATGTATVNDAGLSAGGALYDYSGGSAPAKVLDSYFFIYNKDKTAPGGQAAKIVSWVDLTDKGSASPADVAAAIAAVGAANLTSLDQFAWWKSEVNARQLFTSTSDARGRQVPVLTDAANDASEGGWRINQVTYPELVDLLKNGANTANAVILFGGTWCPNTRPVLPAVNKYAQENNVQVFNFDTVLDGGTVGGVTTSAVNPLQVRNTAVNGQADKSNPSFLYGDLLDQYLTNVKTQYDPATSSVVTYYKGAGSGALTRTKKLQVPFVIGYQGKTGDDPNGGVTRQWIIDKGNSTYTEYMSQWWYTNPQPNQLGLNIPLDAPIWSTLNSQLANFSYQSDPTKLYVNTASEADDTQFLNGTDKASVSYSTTKQSWTIATGGTVAINPTALAAALSALGGSAPANLAAAKTALLAAQNATPQDQTLINNLTTVVGAWGIAQSRKNAVNGAWGNANSPGSVAGGLAAVHALDVFFGGLPGGVLSRRTVTADPVTYGTAPTITVAIANDYGRVPTGNVSLVVKTGGTTVASASTAVANDTASFTLPVLDAGTYDYTLSYAGDDQIAAFTETGSLTVSPAEAGPVVVPNATPVPTPISPPVSTKVSRTKASKVKGAVAKAPTSKKAGKYKVTITTPKGASTASGKVTIKLKKGKTTKTITGKLSRGVATVPLPKLARGTWKVTISWPGDSSYLAASVTGASIKVKK
jgi:thiol-disulfide isomerase/thioredoxin